MLMCARFRYAVGFTPAVDCGCVAHRRRGCELKKDWAPFVRCFRAVTGMAVMQAAAVIVQLAQDG